MRMGQDHSPIVMSFFLIRAFSGNTDVAAVAPRDNRVNRSVVSYRR